MARRQGSIEHLMPQEWRRNWDADGSIAADEVAAAYRDHVIHALGTLVLMTEKLNSSFSNSAWSTERVAIDGASFMGSSRLRV